jgi:FkbH-like protein
MKLIEAYRLSRESQASGAPAFDVGLACGFTPLHLSTFLHAHLRQLLPQYSVTIRTGLYGDLIGAVRAFAGKNLNAALIAMEWPDLDGRLGIRSNARWTTASLDDMLRHTDLLLTGLGDEMRKLAERTRIVLSLPTLPLPPVSHVRTTEASHFEIELRRILWRFAGEAAVVDGIAVVAPDELNRVSPPTMRHDPAAELVNGFPYRLEHTDALTHLATRLLVPYAPKKGLITDLDDTLWRGLLGEEGVNGVHWDLDHRSQIHAVYQNVLNSLAESGVLIAAASKNDPGRVQEALQRSDLILRPECVFPTEAHWEPKSTSVARILQAWNIGADSVIFVDDSPIELAEVQAAHPQIECILFPKDDPGAAMELFYRLREIFGKRRVVEEDRLRLTSIRNATEMRAAEGSSDTMEDLLRTAESRAVLFWNHQESFARALELVNKTNQFNLNGSRHTEVSLREYLSSPEAHLIVTDYQDRFGKLGKISVLAGKRIGDELRVDTWVMSCRAFSRRIEYFCLRAAFCKLGVNSIAFEYQDTGRNGPIRDFLESVCGQPLSGTVRISREAFAMRCPPVYIDPPDLNSLEFESS